MISWTRGEYAKFWFSATRVCKTRLEFQHTISTNKTLEFYGISTSLVDVLASHLKLKVLFFPLILFIFRHCWVCKKDSEVLIILEKECKFLLCGINKQSWKNHLVTWGKSSSFIFPSSLPERIRVVPAAYHTEESTSFDLRGEDFLTCELGFLNVCAGNSWNTPPLQNLVTK